MATEWGAQTTVSGKVVWFGGMISEEEFLAQMVEEQRLLYEFDVKRAYGYY